MTEWVLSAYRGLTEDICLVTHGGVIAAIMASLFPEENKHRYSGSPKTATATASRSPATSPSDKRKHRPENSGRFIFLRLVAPAALFTSTSTRPCSRITDRAKASSVSLSVRSPTK